MKRIVLLRHAKSSWEWDLPDIDRPLTPKGIERITQMSRLENNPFQEMEAVFSSPANRATHTAILMMRNAGISLEKLQIFPDLYTFSVTELMACIHRIPASFKQIVLVGHNPAFTAAVNSLSTSDLDHLPTAAWAEITFPDVDWDKVNNGTLRLGHPKNLL